MTSAACRVCCFRFGLCHTSIDEHVFTDVIGTAFVTKVVVCFGYAESSVCDMRSFCTSLILEECGLLIQLAAWFMPGSFKSFE